MDDVIVLCDRCHATHHRKLGRLPAKVLWSSFFDLVSAERSASPALVQLISRAEPEKIDRNTVFLTDAEYSESEGYTQSLIEMAEYLNRFIPGYVAFIGPVEIQPLFAAAHPA
ncbi:hypothetical protein [Stutzerimonas kunmingensis]|uniref:hypothetical protein n=1 Tax=Stutzerimonas kunmingensis TaxID=1211807 RepID=UPI0011B03D76|nr:hypothetical protein [Stutzerimonas kunmingensis]